MTVQSLADIHELAQQLRVDSIRCSTSAGEVEYVRPFRLTITGTAADRPGLSFSAKMPDPWVMPGIEEQPGRV